MKAQDIKKVKVITSTSDDEEEYTYTVEYNRIGVNEFQPRYTTTSNTKMCEYCGNWKYGDDEDCDCTEAINLTEDEVIDMIYAVYDDNIEIYINNYKIK